MLITGKPDIMNVTQEKLLYFTARFRASLPEGGDLPFICGFGSASALWFLTLSTVVSLLGSRFNEKILNVINKVCGGVIIFYGCKLLWSFVKLMGWL